MKAAVTFLFLLSGCCIAWTEGLTVKGRVGETVRINCTHINAHSNIKYFCKGECNDEDVLIRSRPKTKGSDRYSIEDKGDIFITTIRDLRLEDAGTYWCGIERLGPDAYVEVHLKVTNVVKSNVHDVKEAITKGFKPTARPTDFINESSREENISGSQGSWILTVAMCMVALLFVCLFTFLLWLNVRNMRNTARHRHRTQESNREKENDYETIVGPPRLESKCVRSGCTKRCPLPPGLNIVPPKPRHPTVSACITIDLNEHADVADSGLTCHYQSLNLNLNEESLYHTVL